MILVSLLPGTGYAQCSSLGQSTPIIRRFTRDYFVAMPPALKRAGQPGGRFLNIPQILPGGRVLVASIEEDVPESSTASQAISPHQSVSYPGPNGEWPANRFVCLVAFDLESGGARLLTAPPPIRDENYRHTFDIWPRVGRWQLDSCLVEMTITSTSLRTSDGRATSKQRKAYWEWWPLHNELRLLGAEIPEDTEWGLHSLASALAHTGIRISWPTTHLATGSVVESIFLEHRAWPRRMRFVVKPRQSFFPTEVANEVIVFGRTEEPEEHWIGRLALTPRCHFQWVQRQPAIEKIVGAEIRWLMPIEGIVGPAKTLPLYIQGKSETTQLNPYWTLDVRTGQMSPLNSLPPMSIPEHASASPDGRRLLLEEIDLRTSTVTVRVNDNQRQIVTEAHSEGTLMFPEGFTNRGNVVLCDAYRIYFLPPPYTGQPQLFFSVRSTLNPDVKHTADQP